MTFNIPSGLTPIYNEMMDAVVRDLGKTCTIYYPPKQVECANCYPDPITKKSGNRYKAGGPVPFTGGICPWCLGEGAFSEDVTESIVLRIYWNPKSFTQFATSVMKPGDTIKVRGLISDIPKLRKAAFLEVHDDISDYGKVRFVREGEFGLYGLGDDRYFNSFWKRIN